MKKRRSTLALWLSLLMVMVSVFSGFTGFAEPVDGDYEVVEQITESLDEGDDVVEDKDSAIDVPEEKEEEPEEETRKDAAPSDIPDSDDDEDVVESEMRDGSNPELDQRSYNKDAYVFYDTYEHGNFDTVTNVKLNGKNVDAKNSMTTISGRSKLRCSDYFPNARATEYDAQKVTLTITAAAGYYVSEVVIACCSNGTSSPYSCRTWNAHNAFDMEFKYTGSNEVSFTVSSKDFSHTSKSPRYFIIIKTMPTPSPLYVAYDYGDITNVEDIDKTAFNTADGWTTADSRNNGTVVTANTQYKYERTATVKPSSWLHYANGISGEAIAAAAAVGYEFDGWLATYYADCDSSYNFSNDKGSAPYSAGQSVTLNLHVKLVAQWKKVEIKTANVTVTKKVEGAVAGDPTEFKFLVGVTNGDKILTKDEFSVSGVTLTDETTSAGGYSFKLKDNETATFTVPVGAQVAVSEDNASFYRVADGNDKDITSTRQQTAVAEAGKVAALTFKNVRQYSEVIVTKSVSNFIDDTTEFEFSAYYVVGETKTELDGFKLKAGEEEKLTIPTGAKLYVSEAKSDAYTIKEVTALTQAQTHPAVSPEEIDGVQWHSVTVATGMVMTFTNQRMNTVTLKKTIKGVDGDDLDANFELQYKTDSGDFKPVILTAINTPGTYEAVLTVEYGTQITVREAVTDGDKAETTYTVNDGGAAAIATQDGYKTTAAIDVVSDTTVALVNDYTEEEPPVPVTHEVKVSKTLDADTAYVGDSDAYFTFYVNVFNNDTKAFEEPVVKDSTVTLTKVEKFPYGAFEAYSFEMKVGASVTFIVPDNASIGVMEVNNDFKVEVYKDNEYITDGYTQLNSIKADVALEFKNIRKVATVNLKKVVEGSDTTDAFDFQVSVTDAKGNELSYEYRQGDAIRQMHDGNGKKTFSLANGQNVELYVPAFAKVVIEEKTVTGFETSAIIDGLDTAAYETDTGKAIGINSSATTTGSQWYVTFTNKVKSSEPTEEPTVQPTTTPSTAKSITVTKNVIGGDTSKSFHFEYTITNPDNSTMTGFFNLSNGGTANILYYRSGASIVIRETTAADYVATYTVGGNGLALPTTDGATQPIAMTDGLNVTFNNNYNYKPTETPEPTAEPTPEPTVEPTAEPTVEPTAEPTAEPTVKPTAEPTKEPDEIVKTGVNDYWQAYLLLAIAIMGLGLISYTGLRRRWED